MTTSGIVRTSLAFSVDDDRALAEIVAVLLKAGKKARPLTVLRAVIYMASESDLIAHCVRLTAALARDGGEDPPTVSRPTVEIEKAQLRKLDAVVQQLSRANIVATRTFVVRALLREVPKGRPLVRLFEEFEEKFPLKPRGLSKLRLEQKSRAAG